MQVLWGKARYRGEKADPFFAGQLIFTNAILLHIVKWTNRKIIEIRVKYDTHTSNMNDTDFIGMNAFFWSFCTTFFFCIEVWQSRRQITTNEIRFDSSYFLYIEQFYKNFQAVYGIGQSTIVDEMLVSLRGKVRFKMYITNIPCKYELKIMVLTDTR